jgi:hypothetical protein
MTAAERLSQFEQCPRLPILAGSVLPPAVNIRESVRREFSRSIGRLVAGEPPKAVAEDAEQAILRSVAEGEIAIAGGDVYTLARDHASWLAAAVEIAAEVSPPLLKPCADVQGVALSAYSTRDGIHVFRVGSGATEADWNVLLCQTIAPVTVHTLVLPSVRHRRLPSPLNMGYAHPLTGQIRLARRDGEKAFGPKWKRLGRWERDDIRWEEWRAGLDADCCFEDVVIAQDFPQMDPEEAEALLRDMAALLVDINMYSEEPLESRLKLWPRRREACAGCLYRAWCHGSQLERRSYAATTALGTPACAGRSDSLSR